MNELIKEKFDSFEPRWHVALLSQLVQACDSGTRVSSDRSALYTSPSHDSDDAWLLFKRQDSWMLSPFTQHTVQ